MYHGRKKQEKKELTQEEKDTIQEKLNKIITINQTLLKKKANKEYDQASLEQTEKLSFISPDFQTLWNYRREIIMHIFQQEQNVMEKYKMVGKELEFLVKGITRSPKSYTLWFHRQWILEKGLEFEREISKEWQSKILESELKLCDKMLMMDERNFHCWNYRLYIVELYLQEIGKRIQEEDPWETQKSFIIKEFEMAEKMIKKNFSNYSAWHYRSKLMPKIHEKDENKLYIIPFSKITEDLELLKHAIFTDPKDQSPWNYHEWLISLLTPVQVGSLLVEPNDDFTFIIIGLSHKVSNFDSLDISLLDNTGNRIQPLEITPYKSTKTIASAWEIKVSSQIHKNSTSISLCIKDCPHSKMRTVDQLSIFRDLFLHLNLSKNSFELPSEEIWPQNSLIMNQLQSVLNQQILYIKELTDFEKGLRFALLRLLELKILKYEYLANPYYFDLENRELEPLSGLQELIETICKDLIKCDQTHQLYYEKTLRSFNHLYFRWHTIYESGTLTPHTLKYDSDEINDKHMGFFNY